VRYEIDPNNPYPNAFTGHIRAKLKDGRTFEERQPHFRGGAQEPLTRAEIEQKFVRSAMHGGWDEARATKVLKQLAGLFDNKLDMTALRG
jgi:2-methylcitrate dehydratase PrpD